MKERRGITHPIGMDPSMLLLAHYCLYIALSMLMEWLELLGSIAIFIS